MASLLQRVAVGLVLAVVAAGNNRETGHNYDDKKVCGKESLATRKSRCVKWNQAGGRTFDLDEAAVRATPFSAFDTFMDYTINGYRANAEQKPAGGEHYRLLAYLAAQLEPGERVIDVGTRYGTSALAFLGAMPHARTSVHTVDLAGSCEYLNTMQGPSASGTRQGRAPAVARGPRVTHFEEMPNLYIHRTDLLAVLKTDQNPGGDQCLKDKVLGAALILLDTHHFPETTPFEYEFVELLSRGGFRGLLLLDDIHLNAEMQRFWKWFTEKRAPGSYTTRDVTAVGHGSGTGWVDFSTNRPAASEITFST